MQFTACNGKITCVDAACVPAELLGEICALDVSLLGTRCKKRGWRAQDLFSCWEKFNFGCLS